MTTKLQDQFTEHAMSKRSTRLSAHTPGAHPGWYTSRRYRCPLDDVDVDSFGGVKMMPGWADHSFYIEDEEHESVVYYFSPYNLGDDIIGELANLTMCGWNVHVAAWNSSHAEGLSMLVTIKESEDRRLRFD